MEFKLKVISKAGVEEANANAELYRLPGELEEAESICQDVLGVIGGNQLALRLRARRSPTSSPAALATVTPR